jgi:hypothetical protein
VHRLHDTGPCSIPSTYSTVTEITVPSQVTNHLTRVSTTTSVSSSYTHTVAYLAPNAMAVIADPTGSVGISPRDTSASNSEDNNDTLIHVRTISGVIFLIIILGLIVWGCKLWASCFVRNPADPAAHPANPANLANTAMLPRMGMMGMMGMLGIYGSKISIRRGGRWRRFPGDGKESFVVAKSC